MNEFIESHGIFSAEEFMRLVNEELDKRNPSIKKITLEDANFYHYEMALGVDTVIEEHMHYEQVYG